MNKKGQALIEFIIILPLFLMIVLAIVDFGKIIYEKNYLENRLNEVSALAGSKTVAELNEIVNNNKIIVLKENLDGGYIKITLKNNIDIITPGLNLIINDPYEITTSITLYE